MEYAHQEILLITAQIQELMIAKRQTKNDHNLVFYDNGSVSWMDEDIRDDGVTTGDTFIITNSIADIFTTIMTNSGLENIFNLNFEPTDEFPETEDLKYTSFLSFVTKWKGMLNAAWWIDYSLDPVNSLPTLNFKTSYSDVLDQDGNILILTDADIIDFRGAASYFIDGDRETDTVHVIAGNGVIYTASNTIEHSHGLGAEEIVIKKPDLETFRQAKQYGDSQKLILKDADRDLVFKINYDRANQDYSNISLGKYIQVKLPADGSIINHISAGDGKLLIMQREFNFIGKFGYRNILTITCRKRVLS